MATNSNSDVTPLLPYDPTAIIQRGLKRTLPVKLTKDELLDLALQRADKAALRAAVVADFDKLKAKHKAQLEEMDGEIDKADRELHAREQDRIVICTSVFHRDAAGSGFVHVYRADTNEIVENRPCTVAEAQRYLPGVEGAAPVGGPILDRAPAAAPEPDEDDGTDGVTDIDELARQADDEEVEGDAAAGKASRDERKTKARAARRGGGK